MRPIERKLLRKTDAERLKQHPAYDAKTGLVKPISFALSAYNDELREKYGKDAYELTDELGVLKALEACMELKPPCFGRYPEITPDIAQAVRRYAEDYQADGGGWATAVPDYGEDKARQRRFYRAMTCMLHCPERKACYEEAHAEQQQIPF